MSFPIVIPAKGGTHDNSLIGSSVRLELISIFRTQAQHDTGEAFGLSWVPAFAGMTRSKMR